MIISMEYKIYKRSMSVDLSKGILVCPLLSFYFLFLFFFVASLDLSIYLSFVLLGYFVLSSLGSFFSSLGSFVLSSLGSFPHFRGNTLYITRGIEDLSHFTKSTHIKKM